MESRSVYVSYINKTPDAHKHVSFLDKLKAYSNRPFDKKKDVIANMGDVDRREFQRKWDAQVANLKAFENQIGLVLPLPESKLEEWLYQLENKLEELVGELIDELNQECEAESELAVDRAKHETDSLEAINTIARAYAFHLLTGARPVTEFGRDRQDEFKALQEFHRLLRKAIFSGTDIVEQFKQHLASSFQQDDALNQTKLALYQGAFGELAEYYYLQGIKQYLNKGFIQSLEFKAIKSTLSLFKNNNLRQEALTLMNATLVFELMHALNKPTQVSQIKLNPGCASDYFEILNNNQIVLSLDQKKTIYMSLIDVAYEGKFIRSNNESVTAYNTRYKFIEHLRAQIQQEADINLKTALNQMLQSKFGDFKDPDIRRALSLDVNCSNTARLFSGVRRQTAATAASGVQKLSFKKTG